MPDPQFVAHASAHHHACGLVEQFLLNKVLPVAERAECSSKPAHQTYVGYLHRSVLWLRTLTKLDNPGHFQAATAGARSLFEIAVDLTLLAHDSTSPVEKLLAWEFCAKHKSAKGKIEILRSRNDEHSQKLLGLNEGAVTRDAATVASLRNQWWNGDQPSRWTGRSLDADAKVCDKLTSSRHGDYYRLRFVQLCWTTHGSTLIGIRDFDEDSFVTLMSSAFEDAVTLSKSAAELVLTILDRNDAVIAERFRTLDEEITKGYAIAMGTLKP